jgi:rhodanese-related sulfurtransferase
MSEKSNGNNSVVEVTPNLVSQWIESGQAVLVDVREDFEYAAERIGGARNCPASHFEPDELRRQIVGKRIVFHCRTGKRSNETARRFQSGEEPVFCLAGGIEAWKAAGLQTERLSLGPRIDVMRQTQIAIGVLVLMGVLLGALVSPWFLLLSGFMGAGLIFAGASGTCGMARVLAKFPWNRASLGCHTTCARRDDS